MSAEPTGEAENKYCSSPPFWRKKLREDEFIYFNEAEFNFPQLFFSACSFVTFLASRKVKQRKKIVLFKVQAGFNVVGYVDLKELN